MVITERDKKAAMVGILGAMAIAVAVDNCDKLEKRIEHFFGKENPTVVYQIQEPQEQDPYKYAPRRPISNNPHHYIANPE